MEQIFKNEKLNKFKFIEMTPGYKSKGAHIFGFRDSINVASKR